MTDRELMQQALDTLDLVTDLTSYDDEVYEAIEALRARLAQPEEPDWSAAGFGKSQPEQEYRDVVIAGDLWRIEFLPNNDANVRLVKANYTAPPQREWQGLTDEEMHECAGEYPWTPTGLKCCRAIEAKLKEKNT